MAWIFLFFGCTAGEEPASVIQTTPSGEILYIREGEGRQEIWKKVLSGGEEQRIGGVEGLLYPGPLDPRGEGVLVISVEARGQLAWLMVGDVPTLLAPPAGRLKSPCWSPDGAWLYVEADWKSFGDIYRIPRSGGEPGRLTAEEGGSFEPVVSPDGTQIAFGSGRDGNAEIYVMGASGGEARRLTEDPGDDSHPRWRNNEELAWLSRKNGQGSFLLAKIGEKGRPIRRLEEGEEELDLVFSPDGSLAAVTVRRKPHEQGIELVEVSSGRRVALLDEEGPEEFPAFSPDGQWLVFGSSRSGDPELWLVRRDGTSLRRLTEREGADWLPRWGGGR